MIMGECPYCNAHIFNPIGKPPCFTFPVCESCGKKYALRHSRLDPVAMPIEEFEKLYIIDEEKKTIKDRT